MRRLLPEIPADAPLPASGAARSWRSAVLGAIVGGGGAMSAYWIASAIDRTAATAVFRGTGHTLWFVPALVGGVFLVLLLHELGHLVAGVLGGFQFALLVIGPLRIAREDDGGGPRRIRVRLNRSLAEAGGLAATIPRDDALDGASLVRKFVWILAGGPIASALTAVIAGVSTAMAQSSPFARAWLAACALMATATLLGTIIPANTGIYLTDGARLLGLLRSGAAARRDAALLWFGAANRAGRPIATWSADAVRDAATLADGGMLEMQARGYAYMWAVAKGAMDEGAEQLDRAAAIAACLMPATISNFDNERRYIDAIRNSETDTDTDVTRAASDRAVPIAPGKPRAIRTYPIPAHAIERMHAAQAATRADWHTVHQRVTRARALLDALAPSASVEWERDRIREIEARIPTGGAMLTP